MKHIITIETCRSYATESGLIKALTKMGLYDFNEGQDSCRYIICKTPFDRWTAVFLVSEYANKYGGYLGFASQKGFVSV